MSSTVLVNRIKNTLFVLSLTPSCLYASFIESTIGTAVVNDATATYHNPAALTLLKKTQIIGLGSLANFRTQFRGELTQPLSDSKQTGNSRNQTQFLLPSAYLGIPMTDNIWGGLALIYNSFNKELEGTSILRYAQSSSHVQDIDLAAAIGVKVNSFLSLGGGVNLSKTDFLLEPIYGFSNITIPDSQSHNQSEGKSWNGDIGLLLKPAKSTLIGFNYRSITIYRQKGRSILESIPPLVSDDYHFKLWTPARSILSINHFVKPNLGLVGTVQYIQWGVMKNVIIHNLAAQTATKPLIVPETTVPYHLHDSWLVTLGTHYRPIPKCIIRIASTYIQSPENGNYQITTGDNLIVGSSVGYKMKKNISIDASYAHGFFKEADIHIASRTRIIHGVNKASRDSISLKLTVNL